MAKKQLHKPYYSERTRQNQIKFGTESDEFQRPNFVIFFGRRPLTARKIRARGGWRPSFFDPHFPERDLRAIIGGIVREK